MDHAHITSVNTGRARDAEWAGRLKRTAIGKTPATGRVAVHSLGLAGDEIVDKENHGGIYQALYAFAREDYDFWAAELGRELRDGLFGENLTTRGLDVTGALLGERWRMGTALVEVTSPRAPCVTFRGWMGERGWVKRFADAGRPGAYLRVLEEGEVAAGDAIEIAHRPEAGVTVGESLRAYYGDQELMRRILTIPDRMPRWDERAKAVLT